MPMDGNEETNVGRSVRVKHSHNELTKGGRRLDRCEFKEEERIRVSDCEQTNKEDRRLDRRRRFELGSLP